MTTRRQGVIDLAGDRAEALRLTLVSRETLERLDRFAALLLAWQSKINLIAPSTVPHVWTRHIADSLQLLPLVPKAKTWVDLGSGGGLPGIPIACALADTHDAQVHLVESNGKRAAFLRESVRVLGLPARVHHIRVENIGESWRDPVDVVTARALAPLKTLCNQALPWLERGAIGLFPKGQDVDAELTAATKYWILQAETVSSKTDPNGRIVVIRGLKPRIKG